VDAKISKEINSLGGNTPVLLQFSGGFATFFERSATAVVPILQLFRSSSIKLICFQNNLVLNSAYVRWFRFFMSSYVDFMRLLA
jgi:hypothetical protein